MAIILVIFLIRANENYYEETKRESLLSMVGTYQLDIARTNLKMYKEDAEIYKNLILTLKEDGTFKFNMAVPFICETEGTWEGAELGNPADGWANIMHGCNDAKFSLVLTADSTFQMLAMRPQKDSPPLGSLFFRKIKNGTIKKYS